MPKRLLLSGLQVALAEAVLWRWQAEQRHGPRRIAGRSSKIETNGSKIESHMELSWKQRDPRWNPRISSAGSKGIQDGIPDGTQTEAKGSEMESEMESQMELRWKQRNSRLTPTIESK